MRDVRLGWLRVHCHALLRLKRRLLTRWRRHCCRIVRIFALMPWDRRPHVYFAVFVMHL